MGIELHKTFRLTAQNLSGSSIRTYYECKLKTSILTTKSNCFWHLPKRFSCGMCEALVEPVSPTEKKFGGELKTRNFLDDLNLKIRFLNLNFYIKFVERLFFVVDIL